MKCKTRLRLTLLLSCLLSPLAIGCNSNDAKATAKNEAGARAAMSQGAAPTSDKGQTFQAPPAPPP